MSQLACNLIHCLDNVFGIKTKYRAQTLFSRILRIQDVSFRKLLHYVFCTVGNVFCSSIMTNLSVILAIVTIQNVVISQERKNIDHFHISLCTAVLE